MQVLLFIFMNWYFQQPKCGYACTQAADFFLEEVRKQTVAFRLEGKNIWEQYYTLPLLNEQQYE